MFGFGKKKKKDNSPSQTAEAITTEVVDENPEPEAPIKDGLFAKIRQGLGKSSSKFNEGLKDILVRRKLDDEMLEQLEELLIMSDLGVKTASYITQALAKDKFDKEISEEQLKEYLATQIEAILQPVMKPLEINSSHTPQVIMTVGVNGTGKTTTIGKLGNFYQAQGKTVMLAACDTFRAAAVEQLNVWATRNQCPIVTGKPQADPASVAYEAFEQAKAQKRDILIIDTAGRLQNKKDLMEQLAKVFRVIQKIDASAPHHSVIVLDATTGQNAASQVKAFKEMTHLTGIIVTKLDGTARGGVVVGLAKEFGLPIHAIGVGEGIDDLQPFDAKSFSKGLVGL